MGSMFRLTKDVILPAADQRVLKAADAVLMTEAQKLLDVANERAEQIIRDAEAERLVNAIFGKVE